MPAVLPAEEVLGAVVTVGDQMTQVQLGCLVILWVSLAWLFVLDPLWDVATTWRTRRLARRRDTST